MGLAPALRLALDVVIPPTCGGCGLPGRPVCAACRSALAPLAPPLCARCGHPWPVAVPRCPQCAGPLACARQATAYDGPAPALVQALKDDRRRDLALPLARLMAERIPRPPRGTVLVPVPLAPGRLAERGFNQAALLAAGLGARWGLPVSSALERARDGPPQRGAPASERRRQVAGAFRATGPVPLAPCLVDDVHTTGSTLAACARALRAGGARRVGAVAFARALGPGASPAGARHGAPGH